MISHSQSMQLTNIYFSIRYVFFKCWHKNKSAVISVWGDLYKFPQNPWTERESTLCGVFTVWWRLMPEVVLVRECNMVKKNNNHTKEICSSAPIHRLCLKYGSFNNRTVTFLHENICVLNRKHPMHLEKNITGALKHCKTCRIRSSKPWINTGLRDMIRTVSHLANCPLAEPSELEQQGAHCLIRGTSLPCWWSCLVSEPPPMQFPLMKTLGTWAHKSRRDIDTVWMTGCCK